MSIVTRAHQQKRALEPVLITINVLKGTKQLRREA